MDGFCGDRCSEDVALSEDVDMMSSSKGEFLSTTASATPGCMGCSMRDEVEKRNQEEDARDDVSIDEIAVERKYRVLPFPKVEHLDTLDELGRACVNGSYVKLRKILEKQSPRCGKTLQHLSSEFLERQYTEQQLTPLLLVFAKLRELKEKEVTAAQVNRVLSSVSSVSSLIRFRLNEKESLVKTVQVLLEYGAKPDVRDSSGRTVAHYAATQYSTEEALAAMALCAGATTSVHCFGKEATLKNMGKKFDGKKGVVAGFVAGRRIFYIFGQKEEVQVQNRNIWLASPTLRSLRDEVKLRNLVNLPDNSGQVCLHAALALDSIHLTQLLITVYKASIDIADENGVSPRKMAFLHSAGVQSAAYVRSLAVDRAKQKQWQEDHSCSYCGEVQAPDSVSLRVCKHCLSVKYCCNSCQTKDWVDRHRQECRSMRRDFRFHLVISHPSESDRDSSVMMWSGASTKGVPDRIPSSTLFRRPQSVAIGKEFTVKVNLRSRSLLVHDRSRQCQFRIGPDQACYRQLRKVVKLEKATAGTVTFMPACFDKEGNCRLFLNRTKIRSW